MDILSKEKAKLYSPLALAYYGDSVYELLVRKKTLLLGNTAASKLHNIGVAKVCASYQSKAFGRIEEMLTEEEGDIYRRGRNANSHVPRSSTPRDYHRATGLETLFGYLFLTGNYARADELFEVIYNEEIEKIGEDKA